MNTNPNIEESQEIVDISLEKYRLAYLKTKPISTWTGAEIARFIDAFVKEDIAPKVLIPFNVGNIKFLLSQSYCRRCGNCCTSNVFTIDDPGIMVFEEELKKMAKHSNHSYKQLLKKSTKK